MLAARLLAAATGLILARLLDVTGYGTYAAVVAFGTIFATATDLNLSSLIIQEFPKGERAVAIAYGNAFVLKGSIGVVVFGIAAVLASLIYPAGEARLAILATAAAMVGAVSTLQIGVIQGRGWVGELSLWAMAIAVVTSMTVLVTAWISGEPSMVLVALLSINGVMVMALLTRTLSTVRPKVDLSRIRSQLLGLVAYGTGAVAYVVYYQVDLVMLLAMGFEIDAGLYAVAYRLVGFQYVIPSALAAATYPFLFRLAGQPREHWSAVKTLLRRSGTLGIVSVIALFLAAGPIVDLLFGAAYDGAAELVRILVWFPGLQSLSFPLGDALTTRGHQSWRAAVMVSAAGFNVLGNLLLIPRLGARGAALMTLGTEGLVLLTYVILVRRMLILDRLHY